MSQYLIGWKQLKKEKVQRWSAIHELKKQKKPLGKAFSVKNLLVGVMTIGIYLFVITVSFYQFTN